MTRPAQIARSSPITAEQLERILELHGGRDTRDDERTRLVRCLGMAELEGRSTPFSVALIDLSRGGVGLLATQPVPVGARLTIEADLAIGRVRWRCVAVHSRMLDGGRHRVGAAFIEPGPAGSSTPPA